VAKAKAKAKASGPARRGGPLDLVTILDGKWEDGSRPKDLYAQHIRAAPAVHVGAIIDGLHSTARKVQSGCAELASLLAEEFPETVYPHIDEFVANLDANEKVLRWEAVCTLGCLAGVDATQRRKRVPAQIPVIGAHLQDESIVLQGHAVRALARIAVAYHKEAPAIVELLVAAADRFPGNRVGFLVEAAEQLAGIESVAARLRRFVEPYESSDVAVVARKARRALKKLKQRSV